MKRRHRRESGFVLIAVLVCLGVIIALVYGSLQLSMRQRHMLDRELQMEQTRWLAKAGIQNAIRATGISGDSEPPVSLMLKPSLAKYSLAEVSIQLNQSDKKQTSIDATATIGVTDRPELQTTYTTTKILKSEEDPK